MTRKRALIFPERMNRRTNRHRKDRFSRKTLLTLWGISGSIPSLFSDFWLMYAVFETGGKQYRASEGDHLKVEMLGSENGSTVTFDRVLLVNKDGQVTVGKPTVADASVTAEVVDAERKDKKVVIFKMKRRKHHRTKNGHRQRHSVVKITGINA